jgi:hypothetical protein
MALIFRQTSEEEVVNLTSQELSQMLEEEVPDDTLATVTVRGVKSITRRVKTQKVEQWKNPTKFKK